MSTPPLLDKPLSVVDRIANASLSPLFPSLHFFIKCSQLSSLLPVWHIRQPPIHFHLMQLASYPLDSLSPHFTLPLLLLDLPPLSPLTIPTLTSSVTLTWSSLKITWLDMRSRITIPKLKHSTRPIRESTS